MNSLVIDTSTNRTSVGLFSGNELIYSGFHDGATAHAEALPRLVSEALKVSNDIDQVVVGMGPGPFTGLRVGIVFAQTFAAARNIQWRGACSLDAIDIDSDLYIVTMRETFNGAELVHSMPSILILIYISSRPMPDVKRFIGRSSRMEFAFLVLTLISL